MHHRKTLTIALLFFTLTIAARLPFLATGKIQFDSDEAVEGLMARHVLAGEFPIHFWGQHYKGVPEVYVAAAVFAVTGSSVIALKSVTLAFFALYVGLNYVLLSRLFSTFTAVSASLLLIVCPPALVLWSLCASAEFVLVMLLGTILLMLVLRWQQTRLPAVSCAAWFVAGFALWVHQISLFYLLPVVLILVRSEPWRTKRVTAGVRFERPTLASTLERTLVWTTALAAFAYFVLFLVAFTTGGFSVEIGSMVVGARAPQKLLRVSVVLGVVCVGLRALFAAGRDSIRMRWRSAAWPALAFFAGYSPALVYSILVAPVRAPERVGNLRDLIEASPVILGNIVPIIAGFKVGTTERLAVPAFAVLPALAAVIAYLWTARHVIADGFTLRAPRTIRDHFFPFYVVMIPLLFLITGVYLDTQSYRYLIPLYAGLCVAWSLGSENLAGRTKAIASVVVAAIVAVHGWQQTVWYRNLTPDPSSIIDCLRAEGVRGGYADYWLSYKLTFLAKEEIIIASATGVDRYPRYTQHVSSLPVFAVVYQGEEQDARAGEIRRFACGDLKVIVVQDQPNLWTKSNFLHGQCAACLAGRNSAASAATMHLSLDY